MPSSRPSPLTLGSSSFNSPTTSPSSETSDSRTFSSDLYLLSATSTLSPSSSYSGTTVTGGNGGSGSGRKTSMGYNSSKRKVNANSYCGRHSDEFLFGGHALGDLWRSLKNGKKE
ncbi:hypothetical protein QBC39DRAFT_360794 [Podospora conica]|nr:hypothetical protein QBC39DRAFT_360794 [Schizothecium conicum]